VRCPKHPAEVQEGLLIHLVSVEQIGVIAEITQEPIQLPEGSFSAVQPPREGSSYKRLRLQNNKANRQKRFLRMPAIRSGIDSNQEKAFEKIFAILLS
jgi:hypothetical protein